MAAPRWAPADADAARRIIAESSSILEAARRLGCHDNTLRKWAREQGIDLSELAAQGLRIRTAIPEDETPDERIERDAAIDRLKSERDEYRRLYQEAVRRVREQDDMVQAIAAAGVRPSPPPKLPKPEPRSRSKAPAREAILLLSDWHLGQAVNAVDTGGLNTYSWETATRRLRRWLDAAVGSIENTRDAYRVDRIVLAMLGDMIEGHDIFTGQAFSLDKDAAVQALDGSALFADAIAELAERLWPVTLDIYAVPGNHGRPGGRKAGNLPPTLSFDYLFYEILRLRLANAPIREWGIEASGRLLFMAAGTPVLLTHGDEVRGWGGWPYYGLDKAHGRLLQELETIFHVWLLGHWHASAALPAGRGMRIVNGCAVGANRLTTTAVLGASAPMQTLLYTSPDYPVAELALLYLDPEQASVRPHIYEGGAA